MRLNLMKIGVPNALGLVQTRSAKPSKINKGTMSDSYKGYEIPEILPDGKLFHIISDEGIFDGYTEIAVLEHWKNKIDTLWRREAIKQGTNIELPDGNLACGSCGSIVFDDYAHYNFHLRLDNVR